MRNIYRPWGHLNWLIANLSADEWHMIGCLSTEARGNAATAAMTSLGLKSTSFMQIIDPPNGDVTKEISDLHKKRKDELEKIISIDSIQDFGLFDPYLDIRTYIEEQVSNKEDILLDISTFPKRFFFPIVKVLLEQIHIKNIVVAYTIPDRYSEGQLSSDHQSLEPIYPFICEDAPERGFECHIVSVGYNASMLPSYFSGDGEKTQVKLLFPFPPGPPGYKRNWDFIRQLYGSVDDREPNRVSARDVSDMYDYLNEFTNGGDRFSCLYPFGPKPISLAMCLFSIKTGFPVYYSQPKVYAPDYSVGIEKKDGADNIYAYAIRLGGTNLYT